MCLPEPIRTCDHQASRLCIHAGSETEQVGELLAGGERWNVSEGIENCKRGTCVVDNLMCEETGKVRVKVALESGRIP
jgi:hypothetical protein